MKRKSLNKFIMMLAVFAALLCATAIQNWNGPAFAEDTGAALDVYADDQLLRSFSMEDLNQIALNEGNKKYIYSCFNTYPTAAVFSDVEGPTVEGILEAALGESIDSLDDGQTITFSGSDGVEESFLKEQLFADRYYFPEFEKVVEKKGMRVIGYQGKAVQSEAMSNADPTDPVISIKEGNDRYGENGNYDVGRLLFGQISPTEQNHAAFVKYLVTGDHAENNKQDRGKITIWSLENKPTQTWNPLTGTDMGSGEGDAVYTGDRITFDRSVNVFPKEGGGRYWIHYTLDGTVPGRTTQMYNYNNYSFGTAYEKINKPEVSGPGELVIRTVVTGYGKRDSNITIFRFQGYDPVDVTITGNSENLVYDGQNHIISGYEAVSQENAADVSLKSSSQAQVAGMDAGHYSMGLQESDFTITLRENDGTSRPRVTIVDGGLTIQKAPLIITTSSKKKVFDGKPLTAPGQISGLIGEDTVTLKMTGARETVGSSLNTYELLWNGTAKAGNYEVTEELGTLTVTKPVIAKPAIRSLKQRGKTIIVKWGKVSGSSGYEVYRALKKTGKYTRVKTVKNGKTVSYKDTKVKKKKTYWYKIRAYKNVGGKTFYSSYSAVKYKKVK